MEVFIGWIMVVSEGIGIDLGLGFIICPLIYPSNPLDPSSWVILAFHCSRLSPLNFGSSESMVSEVVPDIVV